VVNTGLPHTSVWTVGCHRSWR